MLNLSFYGNVYTHDVSTTTFASASFLSAFVFASFEFFALQENVTPSRSSSFFFSNKLSASVAFRPSEPSPPLAGPPTPLLKPFSWRLALTTRCHGTLQYGLVRIHRPTALLQTRIVLCTLTLTASSASATIFFLSTKPLSRPHRRSSPFQAGSF